MSSSALHPAAPSRPQPRDPRDWIFFLALLGHAPLALAIGLALSGQTFLHVASEACAPAVAAVVAYALFRDQRAFRVAGAGLLMLNAAVIIHLGGSLAEWHFHIFVGIAMLVLDYAWLPIVVAAGTSAVHRVLLNEVMPTATARRG